MTIKKFVSEFQDHLVSYIPIYSQLDTTRASSTDYFGAYCSTKNLLTKYETDLNFLETTVKSVEEEIDSILNSLDNKLYKINTFASIVKGINTATGEGGELVTIKPYLLNTYPIWESLQECLTLPIRSTYRKLKSYSDTKTSSRCISKFTLDTQFSTKYLSVKKDSTLSILSLSYYNDSKELLESSEILNTINKTSLIIEIPINTKYVTIESIYENDNYNIELIPLSFKHDTKTSCALPTEIYEYGDILYFNIDSDIPEGCYVSLDLQLVFKDVNNKEVYSKNINLPINSDKKIIKNTKDLKENEKVVGYWVEGLYTEDIQDITENSYAVVNQESDENISFFTESSLKFSSIRNSKTIEVTPTLKMYSLKNNTSTPRVYSITGMTKNV